MIQKILNWWPIWFIRSIFCKHSYIFDKNLYGDAIIHHGFKRSQWYCKKCGKLHFKNELIYDEFGPHIPNEDTIKIINEFLDAKRKSTLNYDNKNSSNSNI